MAVLVLALAWGEAAKAQVSDFDVALFRTRRGADLTMADGVVEFDPRIVQGGDGCAYVVGLEVRDSAQLTILNDSWRGVLACEVGEEAKFTGRALRVVETFQFAVVPGRYSLDVSLQPAGRPEAARRVSIELESLGTEAVLSDLILGRRVGLIDTTEATAWTVRKGQVGIAADPYFVADASRSTLAYYLEVYQPSDAVEGEVEGVIRRTNGDEVTRSELARLAGSGASRPVAGALSLAGLPPGDYAFEVRLKTTDTVLTRSRGFRMARPAEPTAELSAVTELRRYFWGLSDEELEELFGAIEVWLGPGQERKTYRSLLPDGKRQFLVDYFQFTAPGIVGGEQPPLDVYLERVRYVNERLGERAGRGEQAGWHTDRGRVYLLRGRPTQRLDRPFPPDNSAPYEIWSYGVGRGYVYLFVDQTGFRNYRVIFSTDPAFASLPRWQSIAGRAAVEELNRYYGIRPQS